ncbi:fop amine-terminal dimerization domain protein (macronuclear) [Tetrahymena thermophila SB210]|uniref:Fop amine-terminal dimerization domain protein n=1 Tax=Tetrahymena thermophila (strain SB210) TaxID=312017 RepID=I7MAZ1_TETTS|nr:fop amine-terminal dimerization domain protein [Tetrahymena thermophila SB210]EAS06759.1 fop amine-terminal dimerization domain protein [Tetrahymena thermophila SB210]|eukprot:XP_001027001.1 fop amine-terminal dimerization domain protein [Tetrahymena thermophila SB210]
MSEKEEKQLSDLIMQTLEASGSLAAVKAMIRQQVFNVVNNEPPSSQININDKDKKQTKYQPSQQNLKQKESALHMSNKTLQSALKNEEEKLTLVLVKELLKYYQMDYTLNIFSSEANLQEDPDRSSLAQQTKTNQSEKKPILVQIVQNCLSGKNVNTSSYKNESSTSAAAPKEAQKTQLKQKEEPIKQNKEINQKKEAITNKYSVTKYDNIKNISNKYDKNNEIEESMGGFEDISEEEDYSKPPSKPKQVQGKSSAQNNERKNPMFSSMEDTYGASMSYGHDQSVDSMKLEEEYDYNENIA